jgi:hypothetical protein
MPCRLRPDCQGSTSQPFTFFGGLLSWAYWFAKLIREEAYSGNLQRSISRYLRISVMEIVTFMNSHPTFEMPEIYLESDDRWMDPPGPERT